MAYGRKRKKKKKGPTTSWHNQTPLGSNEGFLFLKPLSSVWPIRCIQKKRGLLQMAFKWVKSFVYAGPRFLLLAKKKKTISLVAEPLFRINTQPFSPPFSCYITLPFRRADEGKKATQLLCPAISSSGDTESSWNIGVICYIACRWDNLARFFLPPLLLLKQQQQAHGGKRVADTIRQDETDTPSTFSTPMKLQKISHGVPLYDCLTCSASSLSYINIHGQLLYRLTWWSTVTEGFTKHVTRPIYEAVAAPDNEKKSNRFSGQK